MSVVSCESRRWRWEPPAESCLRGERLGRAWFGSQGAAGGSVGKPSPNSGLSTGIAVRGKVHMLSRRVLPNRHIELQYLQS